MKKSVSMYSFPDGFDLYKAFSVISEEGYEGVELVIGSEGKLRYDSTDKELSDIAKLARDFGLTISGIGARDQWHYNLAGEDIIAQQKAAERIRRELDIAAALGTDAALVSPGYVGYDFLPSSSRVRYDVAYARSAEAFSELSQHAEKTNVKICIENVWNYFLLSPLEFKSFLDIIGSDYVGAYFDIGNCVKFGYPDQWIDILGKHIFRLHFCDFKRSCAGMEGFTDLLSGDVEYDAVAQAAARIGYDSWMTLEVLPNYKQYPELSVRANRPMLCKIDELCSLYKEQLKNGN